MGIKLLVGCCGFPVSRSKYFRTFKTVELQDTFYKIPSIDSAKRLKSQTPGNFIINMKAWQVISHPFTSPTWRKTGLKVDKSKAKNYGYLKPTKENFEAWEKMLEIAHIYNPRVIVVQTPPSFSYSELNLKNAREFFQTVSYDNFIIGWEPRGTWKQYPSMIRKVIDAGRVIHVTDILREKPIIKENQEVLYIRLHGLGGKEVNYRYKYKEEDFEKLSRIIIEILENHDYLHEVYVMFNNIYMFNDAQAFRNYILQKHLTLEIL